MAQVLSITRYKDIFFSTGVLGLHVHTRTTYESDHRKRCDQLRGDEHHLQHIVLLFVALHRSGVLQHVHYLSLHDASPISDPPCGSRRPKIVCLGYTVDQSKNFGHDTCAYGVRRSNRRHLYFMERNVRRWRGLLSRLWQFVHEQVSTRESVHNIVRGHRCLKVQRTIRIFIRCFRYMLALAFIGKAASLLFFFLAWWTYIPPGTRRLAQNSQEEPSTTLTLNDNPHEAPITPATINPIMEPWKVIFRILIGRTQKYAD